MRCNTDSLYKQSRFQTTLATAS
uniref:Uncharacterized protein n=1 Tax=Rhizophora mucronata TaxID=61149 RepID=A0A2P2ITY2_RHIMU